MRVSTAGPPTGDTREHAFVRMLPSIPGSRLLPVAVTAGGPLLSGSRIGSTRRVLGPTGGGASPPGASNLASCIDSRSLIDRE